MTSTENLLAKSKRISNGQEITKTVAEHSEEVVSAAEALFGPPGEPTRLGRCWLRFFRLPDDFHAPFAFALKAAAAFHDWGKANSGFQDAVSYRGEQIIRHEHLSALLMATSLRQWLDQCDRVDWDLALAAVASHHLKIAEHNVCQKLTEGDLFRFHADHADFDRLIEVTADCLALTASECPRPPLFWSFGKHEGFADVTELRKQLLARLRAVDERARGDDDFARMLQAVRSALIAADAAGSATARISGGHMQWIRRVFSDDPGELFNGDWIDENVVGPRIQQLERLGKWDRSRGEDGWSAFQIECGRLGDGALLLAPCGAGKTLAAWRWIRNQLQNRPASRVIFLYPTRATATEGFRDYVSWAPESDAGLMHGTATYELQDLFENPDEPLDFRKHRRYEPDPRLFAIAYWEKRVFSATVDQFFAFLQHAYGPTCLLPVLADSVIVVDEVHSFDKRMLSALMQFRQQFETPMLCMTATLPTGFQTQLEDCGLKRYCERPGDLEAIATRPRYLIRRVNDDDAKQAALTAMAEGKKVLWVVNTVNRAQALASDSAFADAGRVLCYHSRFKLDDRKRHHEEVVTTFKQRDQKAGVLAVATQVCEMSLDLDADVLVTESAPITAMIQRMGRCVRDNSADSERVGHVYVTEPPDQRPYHPEQLQGASEFLDEICKDNVPRSQQDLEEALQRHSPDERIADRACRFLESGPFAMSGEETFRDVDEEFTVQTVLDSEVEAYCSAPDTKKPGYVVPIPRSAAKPDKDPRLPKYLAIAPAERYSPEIGFQPKPREGR